MKYVHFKEDSNNNKCQVNPLQKRPMTQVILLHLKNNVTSQLYGKTRITNPHVQTRITNRWCHQTIVRIKSKTAHEFDPVHQVTLQFKRQYPQKIQLEVTKKQWTNKTKKEKETINWGKAFWYVEIMEHSLTKNANGNAQTIQEIHIYMSSGHIGQYWCSYAILTHLPPKYIIMGTETRRTWPDSNDHKGICLCQLKHGHLAIQRLKPEPLLLR